MSEIKTPVTYESRSKTIYQFGGYGIIAEIGNFTVEADNGIGQSEFDQICDSVGNQIADCLNKSDRFATVEADNVRLREALGRVANQGYPSNHNSVKELLAWIDRNTEIARKALEAK